MKLKLLLLAAAVALLVGTTAIPSMVCAAIPQVEYVRALEHTYAAQANCSGIVSLQSKRQVFLSAPVIAEMVLVVPGDRVEEGQPLAIIDAALTKSVLQQSIAVTQQPIGGTALDGLDLETLKQAATQYGFDAQSPLSALSPGGLNGQITGVAGATAFETTVIPETVLSPMRGMVTDVQLKSGMLSQPGVAAFTVADSLDYAVCVEMPESRVHDFALGDEAVVFTEASPQVPYIGVITTIAPTAHRMSASGGQASVSMTITLQNPDERLRENYSATVKITAKNTYELMSLPYEAIKQDKNDREYVWIYQNGFASKRAVETGQELAECVQIVSGISVRDTVLMDNGTMEEGGRVRLGEEAAF